MIIQAPMSDTPTHIGLIIDGSRRWAKAQGLSSIEGHRQGYFNLKKIGEYLLEQSVSYITAYVWSTENWKRPKNEVDDLLDLLRWVLKEEVDELHAKNIKLRFLGNKDRLEERLLAAIQEAETKTANNTKGTLALCFNYGGQQEIVDATKQIIGAGIRVEDITVESFTEHIYGPDIPPIDLMVRTGSEQRISGFMLWRLTYAELFFSDKLWPSFSPADMDEALAWFAKRDRRFGGDTKKTTPTAQTAKELVSK